MENGILKLIRRIQMKLEEHSKNISHIKVFFSYGHDKHSEVVKSLAEAIERLSEHRVEVWIDHKNICRDSHWRAEIVNGIHSCQSVVAFLSPYSAREKGVCLDEIAIALTSKHGMIRTILLEPGDSFAPPAMVTEYQWGDMSDYPEIQKNGEDAFRKYIDEQAAKIIQLVSGDEIQQYSREVQELRRRLYMPEQDRLTRFDLLLEKEMSPRPWLTELVEKWIETPNASKILMIYGKPGSGKSMFCANLQHYNPRVAASLPCDCQSNSFSNTDDIIRYLAYKLAMRLPDYRKNLLYLLRDEQFTMRSGKDLFDDLLAQPLGRSSIDGTRDHMMVCVDALDESKTDELAKFLAEYQRYMKPWVHFLITARKEPQIVQRFEGYEAIDLDAYAEQTQEDLRIYYHARLDEKLSEFPDFEEFIKKLVESSENVYTYAECICNNILEDLERGCITNLKLYPVPRGIQELFEKTLDRKFNSRNAPYTLNDYEQFWQEPLGMIVASREPLPISTLKQLMGWRNNDLRKFRACLSTMLTESNGCLQVFHRSFGEWLNQDGTSYYTSTEDGTLSLAERCFAQYEDGLEVLDEYMLLNLTKLLREVRKRKEYETVTSDQNYIEKLFEMEEDYRNKSRFSRAMDVNLELLAIFKNASITEKWRTYNLSRAYTCLGCCQEQICRFNDAMQYFQKGLEIFRKLTETYPENPDYQHNYSVSLARVAGIYQAQNNLTEALKLYQEETEIFKKLAETYPEDPDYQKGYSVSLQNLGNIYAAQNNLIEALKLYQQFLEVIKHLTVTYPENSDYQWGYSVSLERVAGIYQAQNNLTEALKLYQEVTEIFKKLTETYPENLDYRLGYSVSLERVAGIYKAQNNLPEALKLYQKDLEISKHLAETYPENPDYQWRYSVSLEKFGNIYIVQNNLPEALKFYKEIMEVRKHLTEIYLENPAYQNGYSVSLIRVAGIYQAQNNPTDALKLYLEALAISERLSQTYSGNVNYKMEYYVSLFKVGIVYLMKKRKESIDYLLQAREICSELVQQYPQVGEFKSHLSIIEEVLRKIGF